MQIDGSKVDRPDAMGWEQALDTFRPFLSYNDLSRSFDKPSELYDIVNKLLGLDELGPIGESLKVTRKPLEDTSKRLDAARTTLLAALDTSTDPRAAEMRAALGAKRGKENLPILHSLVSDAPNTAQPTSSRQLLTLVAPDLAAAENLVANLIELRTQTASLDGTSADQSLALADLVDKALSYHDHQSTGKDLDPETCPVCLTPAVLTNQWLTDARTRIDEIRTRTAEHAELRRAEQGTAQQLDTLVPATNPAATTCCTGPRASRRGQRFVGIVPSRMHYACEYERHSQYEQQYHQCTYRIGSRP